MENQFICPRLPAIDARQKPCIPELIIHATDEEMDLGGPSSPARPVTPAPEDAQPFLAEVQPAVTSGLERSPSRPQGLEEQATSPWVECPPAPDEVLVVSGTQAPVRF